MKYKAHRLVADRTLNECWARTGTQVSGAIYCVQYVDRSGSFGIYGGFSTRYLADMVAARALDSGMDIVFTYVTEVKVHSEL